MKQQTLLDGCERELDQQLREVLEVYQNLPDSQLLQPSATGGWSIASCIEHLNTYAAYYLPRIEQKLRHQPDTIQAEFKHSMIGRYFIGMMDPDKGRKKYRALKYHQPNSHKLPLQILSDFLDHLEHLERLLMMARSKDIQRIKIGTSISYFVRLNGGDAIKFLLTHNRRHLNQARKNLGKIV